MDHKIRIRPHSGSTYQVFVGDVFVGFADKWFRKSPNVEISDSERAAINRLLFPEREREASPRVSSG